MKIFLDVTRLATRIFRNGPTGIDRVEYAYAKQLLATADTVCVFTAPGVSGALRKSRALDVLGRVERAWRLDAGADDDLILRSLRDWFDSPVDLNVQRPARFQAQAKWHSVFREADFFPLRDLVRAATRLNRWADRSERADTIYFHCSHAQLDKPDRFKWLAEKQMKSGFFLHDAIPIEYPEFCSPGSFQRHVNRLATVSSLASVIIVNSRDSRRAVLRALSERGSRAPEIEVIPLAVDETFSQARGSVPVRPTTPYFVFVGTIEPRKNLLFLLSVWRRLVEELGAGAPRLVIAGRRGWENENIVDVLERSRMLAPFIAEASDLTDAGLAWLMAGAAALVAPSFTEGFGLPIVESLAAGSPTLVSDIAAHREVGEDFAIYADAIDGPQWIAAIKALIKPNSELRSEIVGRLEKFKPMTWETHVVKARERLAEAVK